MPTPKNCRTMGASWPCQIDIDSDDSFQTTLGQTDHISLLRVLIYEISR